MQKARLFTETGFLIYRSITTTNGTSMYCSSTTIVKQFVTHVTVNPLKCRCWHCENCVGDRLAQLAALCRKGRPTTFMTFTIRAVDDDNQAERARLIKWAWTNLRRLICRHYKTTKVPFIAIFEETERGEPHLHVLARMGFVDQKWLSKQWERMTGAFIVDIQAVRSQRGVAKYVAKYVSKAPKMWPGTKRYWRSLDWDMEPAPDEADKPPAMVHWWRVNCEHIIVVTRYIERGWSAMTDGRRWACWGAHGRPPPW